MESALYGIFTLVGFVSEISLVRCAHSFDFRYFTNSCENPVRTRFPWSNLYIICKDNVVQNFVLKFSQFEIKCSTERKRINLRPVIDCVWVFVRYLCWAVGGVFFAQKRAVYLFRGDIWNRERATVQFNVRCVRDGSYFIFTDRISNNCFPVRWKRVNNSLKVFLIRTWNLIGGKPRPLA